MSALAIVGYIIGGFVGLVALSIVGHLAYFNYLYRKDLEHWDEIDKKAAGE